MNALDRLREREAAKKLGERTKSKPAKPAKSNLEGLAGGDLEGFQTFCDTPTPLSDAEPYRPPKAANDGASDELDLDALDAWLKGEGLSLILRGGALVFCDDQGAAGAVSPPDDLRQFAEHHRAAIAAALS